MKHHSRSKTYDARSDEYLLELALEGDAEGFGELVSRWQGRIYSFIARHIGDAEEARDLTQETFSKAFQNLSRLSSPAKFSAWLYTIALNESRMRLRRRRVQPITFEDHQKRLEVRSGERTPEKALSDKELGILLRGAFQELPEEQRVVIIMKEYQGLKFQEIADITEVPLSTVKSRMYLGLKTLRNILEKKL